MISRDSPGRGSRAEAEGGSVSSLAIKNLLRHKTDNLNGKQLLLDT